MRSSPRSSRCCSPSLPSSAALGLLGPISQVFGLDDSVKTVVLLIGMAVGVDYALFYVIRSREERQRGVAPHEALERTVADVGPDRARLRDGRRDRDGRACS